MEDRTDPSRRNYTPAETSHPIDRHRRTGQDLMRLLHQQVALNCGPMGVFPQHMFWRRSGMTECFHEQLWAPGGLVVAAALKRIYDGNGVSQLIFGMDVQEPKALPHGAGVIVGYWDGSWRIGCIHYQDKPRIVTPIDWNHQSSINYMHGLIVLYDRKYRLGKIATPFAPLV